MNSFLFPSLLRVVPALFLIGFAIHSPLCAQGFSAGEVPPPLSARMISPPVTSAPPASLEFVPSELRPWIPWVLWPQKSHNCPPDCREFSRKICQWPGLIELELGKDGGAFAFRVTQFADGWVILPGSPDQWPRNVAVNGRSVPVLPRKYETVRGADPRRPAVWLPPGTYEIGGSFAWKNMPQSFSLPPRTGILRLRVNGIERTNATWDTEGTLWLQGERATSEELAEADFLSFTQNVRLRDGIPLWFDSEIELVVAGRSREENLGVVLPAGWQLSQTVSPLPALVDAAGRMRVQVRAGKWKIRFTAFRTEPVNEIVFAREAPAAAKEIFVAWQAEPDFRMVEIPDAPMVDTAQISFPAEWSSLPVYRWETSQPLRIVEVLRGRGDSRKPPLQIERRWWLSQDGKQITALDTITGQGQELWRLDAAVGMKPGAVRLGETGQLLTRNPQTDAVGFEVRQRNFGYTAISTLSAVGEIPATGWNAEAENVRVTLNLPPGWRAFAVWGTDWVTGEWLTSWTLLDLFLLLIFTLAMHRLFGMRAAALAFAAFVLFCHEPDAPKFSWLALLIPIALLRVVPHRNARRAIGILRWALAALLVLLLIPFFSAQIQQAIFPQLEQVQWVEPLSANQSPVRALSDADAAESAREISFSAPAPALVRQEGITEEALLELQRKTGSWGKGSAAGAGVREPSRNQNLLYESKARIQTGPGVPEWNWRTISFGWNGPVSPMQTVELWLISEPLQRALTALQLLLILLLARILFRRERHPPEAPAPLQQQATHGPQPPPLPITLIVASCALLFSPNANAQFPDAPLLNELRERVMAAPPMFPDVAAISEARLSLERDRLVVNAEIHTAARCAVPLPARLNAWFPTSVLVDGAPTSLLLREEESLWVLLEEGVHTVRMEGRLDSVDEWQWSFLLRPLRVLVDAPGWSVGGVNEDGIPENQVIFSREQRTRRMATAYEHPEFSSVARVEREIELGLVWQVRTTVRRLTPPGRAISFEIPLLPGERVLDQNLVVADGRVQVRMGAQEAELRWTSELAIVPELGLVLPQQATWVEQWQLVVSPVWNVRFEGLQPVYAESGNGLMPVWRPWPGEQVRISVARPGAIEGATVTVLRARVEAIAGQRLMNGSLELAIRSSLGEEFVLHLPENLEITGLRLDGKPQPLRQNNGQIAVPLHPGDQTVLFEWRLPHQLSGRTTVPQFVLPVPAVNISTVLQMPEDRWILWTQGPVRGPAVRFWIVVTAALLAAFVLSRLAYSPAGFLSWALLGIGLTQVPYGVALVVVAWLFLLAWRGRPSALALPRPVFNLLQIALPLLTLAVLCVFLGVVAAGLLGDPQMFILGNGSTPQALQWFEPETAGPLPAPSAFSVGEGWYRLLMLAWALWLAAALLRWLRWGWQQYGVGGFWKTAKK